MQGEDAELKCHAIANPGVFCWRDGNGTIQTGGTITLNIGAYGNCGEGGEPASLDVGGYIMPTASAYVAASISGQGVGEFDAGDTEATGAVASATAGGSTIADKTLVDNNETPDFCIPTSNWVGTDNDMAGPFPACCPVAFGCHLAGGEGVIHDPLNGDSFHACSQELEVNFSLVEES